MIKEKVEHLLFQIKRFVVTYSKGYYTIPYVGNSPRALVESIKGMPFTIINEDAKLVQTDNPFIKASCHYFEVEKGLWVFVTPIVNKKDIKHNLIFHPEIPVNYYCLHQYVCNKPYHARLPIFNGICVENEYWALSKPGAPIECLHHKKADSTSITIYFSDYWIKEKLNKNNSEIGSLINSFINSDEEVIFFPELLNSSSFTSTLLNEISNKELTGNFEEEWLKSSTSELVNNLITTHKNIPFLKSNKYQNFCYLVATQQLLYSHVFKSFPGIKYLAKEVGMSETKLKSDFKEKFNSSLFQYYNYKQMAKALEMLKKEEVLIKDLGKNMGYENTSKFSAAFKKYHGFLPSEVNVK